MKSKDKNKKKRSIQGTVISSGKMTKTITVLVKRFKDVIGKTITIKKKYKVHDESSVAKEGDLIEFFEGRHISKTKYMYLDRIVRAAK